MSKKSKLIEPIPATFDEVVDAIFSDWATPKDPEKKFEEGGNLSPQPSDSSAKTRKSQPSD